MKSRRSSIDLMNKWEKKILNQELAKHEAEYDRLNELAIEKLVVANYKAQTGFGKQKCKNFFMKFADGYDELIKRYELEEADTEWLCDFLLKEDGIDIEAWHKEWEERKHDRT